VSGRRTHSGREVVIYGLIVLGLVAWSVLAGFDPPETPEELIGRPAPPLEGQSLTGAGTLALASMKGRPTVVVFWLPWCTHCQELIPALQEAWIADSPDANIMTTGMVYRSPEIPASMGQETPETFVTATGLTLPTIHGEWGRERSRWGFGSVPTAFVLDADHIVRQVLAGSADPAAILAAVRGLTTARPAGHSITNTL
jgi:thiol-disulfide isomerase/thioredoxin